MGKKIVTFLLVAALTASMAIASAAKSGDDEVKVRKVFINVDTITVRVNQSRTLFVEIEPFAATDKTIYWDTSNPDIVVVDGDGVITGVSPGTAQVTATAHNGRSGSVTVTVPGYVLGGIELDESNAGLPEAYLNAGEALSAATLRLDVENAVKASRDAVLTYSDKTTVSAAALRAAAYTAEAGGGSVSLKFITPGGAADDIADPFSRGNHSDALGWITIDPSLAGAEDRDIRVTVAAPSQQALGQARGLLGESTAVVVLSQPGGFGMEVSVAAKPDLTGLDTQALRLYRLDTGTGAFLPLPNQSYGLDSQGYLHFSTDHGGTIAITGT